MSRNAKIDLITRDDANNEFVLYIIEEGPWEGRPVDEWLQLIEARINNAIEIASDGYLAAKFPSSRGGAVRIQVDLYNNPPLEAELFVSKMSIIIEENVEAMTRIREMGNVSRIRLVTRSMMGRG